MSIKTIEVLEPLKSWSETQQEVSSTHKIAMIQGVRTLTGLDLTEAIAENDKRRREVSADKVPLPSNFQHRILHYEQSN